MLLVGVTLGLGAEQPVPAPRPAGESRLVPGFAVQVRLLKADGPQSVF